MPRLGFALRRLLFRGSKLSASDMTVIPLRAGRQQQIPILAAGPLGGRGRVGRQPTEGGTVNFPQADLAGAQELVHILSGAYGIVPAPEHFVGSEVELTHFRV